MLYLKRNAWILDDDLFYADVKFECPWPREQVLDVLDLDSNIHEFYGFDAVDQE